MPHWLSAAQPVLEQYGLPGLFLAVFLEAFGLPLPGETMIILSATLAGAGELNIIGVALTAFAAAVLGDNVGYLVGRFGGRPLIVRHGGRFGVTHERMARVEAVIQKRGPVIVALARFVVLLRQLNGLAAGSAGMHWARFLAANAVGAALWVGLWTTLAYRVGEGVHLLPYLLRHLSWLAAVLVPALLLAGIVGWLAFRRNHRRIAPDQRNS